MTFWSGRTHVDVWLFIKVIIIVVALRTAMIFAGFRMRIPLLDDAVFFVRDMILAISDFGLHLMHDVLKIV